MKEFDLESLAEFNGKDGKPVYIAFQDRVYDVTGSKLWREGLHVKRHHAGRDLTAEIHAAPHDLSVFGRYPQVGVLVKKDVGKPLPVFLSALLNRYPFFRRHPHPMIVHFPIVFMISATVFNLLYLATGMRTFEETAVNCLAGGVLFLPLAILTGYFTWWLNYLAKPMRAVAVKIGFSWALLVLSVFVLAWRLSSPDVAHSTGQTGLLYRLLIFLLAPLVSVIGWYGGQLTFPDEH